MYLKCFFSVTSEDTLLQELTTQVTTLLFLKTLGFLYLSVINELVLNSVYYISNVSEIELGIVILLHEIIYCNN